MVCTLEHRNRTHGPHGTLDAQMYRSFFFLASKNRTDVAPCRMDQ